MRKAEMAAHLEHEDRQRQHQRDPEPPRHVDEFGIRRLHRRVTCAGSSAMPQIGQEPGPTWRISGCIGQV